MPHANINRLEADGTLVQATGSFAYMGAQPTVGAVLTIRGIPVLNLEYLGAIKTAVYGLYPESRL